MGRNRETYNKKEVRKKKEKKKKAKVERREAKKDKDKQSLDDMIAYVDENGIISSTPPEEEKEEVDKDDIEIGIPKQTEEEKAAKLRKGKLSFLNESKGYGFIRDLESSESVFVHVNNFMEDNIQEGDILSFKKEKGKKGPVAIQVKRFNKSS